MHLQKIERNDSDFLYDYRNVLPIRYSNAQLLLQKFNSIEEIASRIGIGVYLLQAYLESTEDAFRLAFTLNEKHKDKTRPLYEIYYKFEFKNEKWKTFNKILKKDDNEFLTSLNLPIGPEGQDLYKNKNFSEISDHYKSNINFMKFIRFELQHAQKILHETYLLRTQKEHRVSEEYASLIPGTSKGFLIDILSRIKHGLKFFSYSDSECIGLWSFKQRIDDEVAELENIQFDLDYELIQSLCRGMGILKLAITNLLDWYEFFHFEIPNKIEWLKRHPFANIIDPTRSTPYIVNENFHEITKADWPEDI